MENNKTIKEMSDKEILRQQLELLAERSIGCLDEELSAISITMLKIATYLSSSDCNVL